MQPEAQFVHPLPECHAIDTERMIIYLIDLLFMLPVGICNVNLSANHSFPDKCVRILTFLILKIRSILCYTFPDCNGQMFLDILRLMR